MIKKYIALIQDESTRANRIISELLDFTRTKSLNVEQVNITDLIDHCLESIQRPDGIVVTSRFEGDIPPIPLDPVRMEQVFQNIITNAYQSMSEGGSLEIAGELEGDQIEITFTDSGTGISAENMENLFEPLFTTKSYGIGLGLPIAKEIVESYHGRIEVASEAGVGTTFTVILPVSQEDRPDPANNSR